jgi:hypothetical protein
METVRKPTLSVLCPDFRFLVRSHSFAPHTRLICAKLSMHLTQVTLTSSMVAGWKITRVLFKNSRPGSRPKRAVASTSFGCDGRRGFGVHAADVARRGRCVPPCSSVQGATVKRR